MVKQDSNTAADPPSKVAHQLSDEVFEDIMNYTMALKWGNGTFAPLPSIDGYPERPLRLVCRKWNRLVDKRPSRWANITMELDTVHSLDLLDSPQSYLRTSLRLSKRKMLSIHFFRCQGRELERNEEMHAVRAIFYVLRGDYKRVRTLTSDSFRSSSLLDVHSLLLERKLSSLRHLHLTSKYDDSLDLPAASVHAAGQRSVTSWSAAYPYHPIVELSLDGLNLLSIFKRSAAQIFQFKTALRQVRSFRVCCLSPSTIGFTRRTSQDIIELLYPLPELENVVFDKVSPFNDAAVPSIPDPDSRLSISSLTLRSLDKRALNAFLGCFLPTTVVLDACRIGQPLVHPIAASASHLVLKSMFPDEDTSTLFELLSSYQGARLTIHSSDIFTTSMFEKLEEVAASGHPTLLWPHLRDLAFVGCPSLDEDTLLSTLEVRKAALERDAKPSWLDSLRVTGRTPPLASHVSEGRAGLLADVVDWEVDIDEKPRVVDLSALLQDPSTTTCEPSDVMKY